MQEAILYMLRGMTRTHTSLSSRPRAMKDILARGYNSLGSGSAPDNSASDDSDACFR